MYWDIGSTNAYFALKLIKPIAERNNAELILHPFNLGYVFRLHNYVLMDEPKIKIENRKRDLCRWAKKYNLDFKFPTEFPIKTSRTLRGAIAMRKFDMEMPFIDAVFSAYWKKNDSSIQTFEGMQSIVNSLGIDPKLFEKTCESDEIREQLIDSTNTGLQRGVFGVPSIFVRDQMFWGKDRMEFVEDELIRISN
jgi:2-hydroxychromene-2-carboxylate isomerase